MNEREQIKPPRVALVISDHPEAKSPSMVWALDNDHPMIEGMKVVAMYLSEDGGVDVYSVVKTQNVGMREVIPTKMVRYVRELMTYDVFELELSNSEKSLREDYEDDGDEEDEEEEEDSSGDPAPAPGPVEVNPNEQPS